VVSVRQGLVPSSKSGGVAVPCHGKCVGELPWQGGMLKISTHVFFPPLAIKFIDIM